MKEVTDGICSQNSTEAINCEYRMQCKNDVCVLRACICIQMIEHARKFHAAACEFQSQVLFYEMLYSPEYSKLFKTFKNRLAKDKNTYFLTLKWIKIFQLFSYLNNITALTIDQYFLSVEISIWEKIIGGFNTTTFCKYISLVTFENAIWYR